MTEKEIQEISEKLYIENVDSIFNEIVKINGKTKTYKNIGLVYEAIYGHYEGYKIAVDDSVLEKYKEALDNGNIDYFKESIDGIKKVANAIVNNL